MGTTGTTARSSSAPAVGKVRQEERGAPAAHKKRGDMSHIGRNTRVLMGYASCSCRRILALLLLRATLRTWGDMVPWPVAPPLPPNPDYGPTFTTGDTVGAGIHLGRQELFFT